jgi:hypothetical protein
LPPNPQLDAAQADVEWARRLPEAALELLPEAVRSQVLALAQRYAKTGAPDDLGEFETAVYAWAREVEPRAGREFALRFLRDGLADALAAVSPEGRSLPAHERLILRATDAVWAAHTDGLQETIRRQQQERFQQELMVAKRIQERLLPRTVPKIAGFDIAGRVQPAAEVGGDYWSCRWFPEDDIVTLKLADVTGHGIAAATLVAAVKFISGGYYRGSKTPAQVMERTNSVLVRETPSEVLVTMVYGWLYPASAEMTVVNAGHEPVLHLHAGRFCPIPPTGIALGMMETKYRHVRLYLEQGDVFVTCSDGVTQPTGDHGLGVGWVQEQVAALAGEPAQVIVDQLIERALHVYGVARDDMSVLVVKRLQ